MNSKIDNEQFERRLAEIDTVIEQWPSDRQAPDSLRRERYELSRALATASRADHPDEADRGVGHVFAIMPFSKPFDAYYEGVIKPAVQDAGFQAKRSDEIFSPQAFVQNDLGTDTRSRRGNRGDDGCQRERPLRAWALPRD